MALQAPIIDDLTFQEIVDDAKRKIGLRCPEWTDHNVSDPGVTLIELFAWMTELLLYRMNRVPERTYIKFLEMLGIQLEPPNPAQVELRFRISRSLEDQIDFVRVASEREMKDDRSFLIKSRTVCATVRTEYSEAVEFSTNSDLLLVAPVLRHIVHLPAVNGRPQDERTAASLDPNGAFQLDGIAQWQPAAEDIEAAPSPAVSVSAPVEETPPFAASVETPDRTAVEDDDPFGDGTPEVIGNAREPHRDSPLDPDRQRAIETGTTRPTTADAPAETALGPRIRRGWKVFSDIPVENDTVWFGFTGEVSRHLVALQVGCVENAATNLRMDIPAMVFEAFNPDDRQWQPVEVVRDTVGNLNRTGIVELALPSWLTFQTIVKRRARWVRCRYTTHPRTVLPPEDSGENVGNATSDTTAFFLTWDRKITVEQLGASPEIYSVAARTTGGTVTASHATFIDDEWVGISDAMPGQIFALNNRPVLARRDTERLYVGSQSVPLSQMTPWTEVPDFSESNPDDRHYMLDSITGELKFGPRLPDSDGTSRQYGMVPERGEALVFSSYRIGGGVEGNVSAQEIQVVKSSIPYISEVSNPRRAVGGKPMESLDTAKFRAQQTLRLRDRAITVEDFEFLALQASSTVGRARCLPPQSSPNLPGPPSLVRVLIVPRVPENLRVPLVADLLPSGSTLQIVQSYLDKRRLIGTQLKIHEPTYVFVSTDIRLIAQPETDPETLRQIVRSNLERLFHPLYGGTNGEGWPFGAPLNLADLYACILRASGIALFDSPPRLHLSRRDGAGLTLTREVEHDLTVDLTLESHELLCSREHRVEVVPHREFLARRTARPVSVAERTG